MKKILVLNFIAILFFSCAQDKKKIDIINDAPNTYFIDSIKAFANRSDSTELLKIIDSLIVLDYGGGAGIELFKDRWKPHLPSSEIYSELTKIIEIGGCFIDSVSYVSPCLYEKYASDSTTGNVYVILKEGAALYSDTGLTEQIGVIAAFDVITGSDVNGKAIKVNGNYNGYVSLYSARSIYDYRMKLVLKNGRWRITELVDGA